MNDSDNDTSITSYWQRFLAGASDGRIDYSVLSVAVMTLGLIMVVEVIRHRLDHAALGRPFFKAVLEGVYAELATLGMVELVIWLLHMYYENLDLTKEQVFAQVHFTLFYTAILNAFQSVIVAIVTTRVSNKIWVQTETLELNHYVEIREEFGRVQAELDRLNHRRRQDDSVGTSRSNNEGDSSVEEGRAGRRKRSSLWASRSEEESEFVFEFNMRGLGSLWRSLVDTIMYPRLKRKYNALLVQVRFHELRVHFLQAYDLPLKLKVSDYLIRSEQNVLMSLVHVSTVAWLLLTASINLLYFVLGVVAYELEDSEIVGTALTWIYFWVLGLYVVIAVLVFDKMKRIFKTIMHQKTLWDVVDNEEDKGELAKKQLSLFWGGDPKLVIAAIQFMSFGYAVALAVVLIFWETIDDGDVPMQWFLIALFGCYTIFVWITAQVIPRFTLCTSLGQLVDQKRLQETLALYHLEEAKQQRLEEMEFEVYDGDTVTGIDSQQSVASLEPPSLGFEPFDNVRKVAQTAREGAVKLIGGGASPKPGPIPAPTKSADLEADSAKLMAELVKLDTKSLRENLPDSERDALSQREADRARRRRRRKSISDGVSLMAMMGRSSPSFVGFSSEDPAWAKDDSDVGGKPRSQKERSLATPTSEVEALTPLDTRPERLRARRHQRRHKTVSDGVAFMASHYAAESAASMPQAPNKSVDPKVDSAKLMAELVKLDTEKLRENLPDSEREVLSQREAERDKRRRRGKTRSDGVAAMAIMGRSPKPGGFFGRASKDPVRAKDDTDVIVKDDPFAPSDTQPERLRARRHRRKRSVSDGAIMGRQSAFFGETAGGPETIPEGNDTTLKDSTEPLTSFKGSSSSSRDTFPAPHTRKSAFSRLTESSAVVTPTALHSIKETSHKDIKKISKEPQDASNGDNNISPEGEDDTSVDVHSDADDIPEVDLSMIQNPVVSYTIRPSFRERLRKYYLSKRYVVMSNVFGTMVAFFLVGQRVERFLHTQGIVSNEFVSFDFKESWTFWMLSTWFFFFLCMDMLLFYSIWRGRFLESNKERKRVVSAIVDILITSVCLIVFYVAESQRCCDADAASADTLYPGRHLAGEDDKDNDLDVKAEPAPCGCPAFGSRLYGGLGTIEPYTSLVALRLFRHWMASRLVRILDSKFLWSAKDEIRDTTRHGSGMDPFDVFGDENGHGHTEEERGTIVELWEAAIGRYPDIVAKHGEFSGELLQAMLGVVPVETYPTEVVTTDGHSSPDDTVPQIEPSGGSVSRHLPKRKSFRLSTQYHGLTPHAQEVIMQGKLGKPVKPIEHSIHHIPETIDEEVSHINHGLERRESGRNLRFELDSEATLSPEFESMFTSPNARLVRNMRRCDRKLLPILDKWTVVDVVMTRFEMVYFDATDVDGPGPDEETDDTRQALAVTRGGKGLRLCDVAHGRRVVGHLAFSDITSVYVKREMPNDVPEHDGPEHDVKKTEYWQNKTDTVQFARSIAWSKIKQDRLKVETVHGRSLYLRYYSDLEDAEHHPERMAEENEEEGPLFKNNAFQWAQTIGRYCGPEQLKQSLPHFGDDTDEELRDYLVVHFLPEGEAKGHRRIQSTGEGLLRAFSRKRVQQGSGGALRPTGSLRRSSSFCVEDGSLEPSSAGESAELSSRHRRFGSMPDLTQAEKDALYALRTDSQPANKKAPESES